MFTFLNVQMKDFMSDLLMIYRIDWKDIHKDHVKATQKRTLIKLHCYFAFKNKYTAYNSERYLKSGSGRVFCKKHFDNII